MIVAIFIVVILLLIVGGSYARYVYTQRKEARERKEQERLRQQASKAIRGVFVYAKEKKQDEEFARQLIQGLPDDKNTSGG